jgi:hypothetical protein
MYKRILLFAKTNIDWYCILIDMYHIRICIMIALYRTVRCEYSFVSDVCTSACTFYTVLYE